MNITRAKARHDIVCIALYFIITTALGLFYCRNITEGYVTMIAVFINALSTAFLSLILILIIKRLTRNKLIFEVLFGLIPFFIFEIIYLVIGQPLVFGLFGSNEAMYEGSEIAMSLSSVSGVIIVYGFSVWIKTKRNNI